MKMAEQGYNAKIIYGNEVLMDLTEDTVDKNTLLNGVTAHNASGEPITGECTYDADTSDATASADEILSGQTAYANGSKVTGSMTNRGGVTGTISTKAGQYTIPEGYHDGSGKVGISSTEQNKIIASNIKSGIVILGVTGTYSGEGATAQAKTVTPSTSQQVITPDANYDYLSQVTVNAIPYTETLNEAGGYTLTIG
jgi:hypothetical protein